MCDTSEDRRELIEGIFLGRGVGAFGYYMIGKEEGDRVRVLMIRDREAREEEGAGSFNCVIVACDRVMDEIGEDERVMREEG